MVSLAVLDVSNENGISNVEAYGNLNLKQLTPLYSNQYKKIDYNFNPFASLGNSTVPNLMSLYWS